MSVATRQMSRVTRQMSRKVAEVGQEKPFEFQMFLSVSKVVGADLLVQWLEGRDSWDYKRTLAFALLGSAYSGGFQYWLFVSKFTKWYPSTAQFTQRTFAGKLKDRQGITDMLKQIGIRNFVCVPLGYFPTFYFFQEFLNAPEFSNTQEPSGAIPPLGSAPIHLGNVLTGTLNRTWQKWKQQAWEDSSTLWCFWVPLDLLIFAGPLWLRLPLIHTGSAVWTGILSALRGAPASSSDAPGGPTTSASGAARDTTAGKTATANKVAAVSCIQPGAIKAHHHYTQSSTLRAMWYGAVPLYSAQWPRVYM